jgi:hypothetical protein
VTAGAEVAIKFNSTGAGGIVMKTVNGFEVDLAGSGDWVAYVMDRVENANTVVIKAQPTPNHTVAAGTAADQVPVSAAPQLVAPQGVGGKGNGSGNGSGSSAPRHGGNTGTEANTVGPRVRYLWSAIPCTQPRGKIGSCAVYAKEEGLPAVVV